MKKILFLLAISSSFFARGQYTQIACAEYGIFLRGANDSVYAYKTTPQGPTLTAFPLGGITDISGGMHDCAAVTSDGKGWILYKPTNTGAMNVRQIPGISGAVDVECMGNTGLPAGHAVFITGSGEAWIVNQNTLVASKLPTTGKIIKSATGNNLYLLNDIGEVFEYPWSSGSVIPSTYNKLTMPPAQDISASRNGFAVFLVDGVPFGWGYNWGYLGVSSGFTNPRALTEWGVPKLKSVACGENSTQMITESADLLSQGDDIQAEVGDGREHQYTWDNKRTNGVPQAMMVKKPVQIAAGRKFKQICKGQTLAYYCYAQETNGTWDFWGRAKAGVSGTGIFGGSYEDLKPNIGDILKPWRVGFPKVAVIVPESYFSSANYPPKESDTIATLPPLTVDAGRDTTMIEGVFTRVGKSNGNVVSWYWEFVSDVEGGHAYTQTFSDVLTSSEHRFVLTVTDNLGRTASDEAIINVLPTPAPVKKVFHAGYFNMNGKRFYYVMWSDGTWTAGKK